MADNILTIEKYFQKGTFVIPNYQRGFKWGVPNKEDGKCAVGILMDNLIAACNADQDKYFVQGVTVHEEIFEGKKSIFLIDGQQRTTTFYLLLKYFKEVLPYINYTIREESKYVINNSTINGGKLEFVETEGVDYNLQDIHYFKKAVDTIHSKITEAEKIESKDKSKKFTLSEFKTFVLEKVKLFYIIIDKEKATRAFSMMNGQKAHMKVEELVKASILSKASRANFVPPTNPSPSVNPTDVHNEFTIKWEVNALRSRYAREWDKWLYWWNRNDVKEFYGSGNNPMGLLLEFFFYKENCGITQKYTHNNKSVNSIFTTINNKFQNDPKVAKLKFKAIRDLQKTFEDWFNDPIKYNYLGLILKTNSSIKKEVLYHFLTSNPNHTYFEEYAKWAICGCTHKQILSVKEEVADVNDVNPNKEQKAAEVINNLSSQIVYDVYNEDAYKQLLRRNVEIDCKLERKFDFTLYNSRSLEHIHPKSLESEMKFEAKDKDNLSVHSIGNLVLLKATDNSSFSNSDFNQKKEIYFNVDNCKWSIKLLHSVSIFSKNEWNEESIKNNQESFLTELKKYYTI